ncbi:septum formation inhibitor Maf [Campylobacter geochelonis]|uniref:Nucleoside triphosphate pyrophosphatase n=1 Tax=Campylobacter geochelonis TaxID=1780362 RepID=A0A128EJJ5_9BACT|nr:septum formation inhibitor Maf [Campylobacter geochelonis]QKF70944.1 septum formation protein Maf [Campylobacter geochelonis]CZE47007.1 Maf-like protein [Campylobacter geochelonis]CZE49115.1 Maf-like protein [Campylobacter geochelonis]CZE51209.1 Maf-like protein [Campylobacter geochelonis]
MIYLASSSPTRAKILKDYGVEFTQIPFSYDESIIAKADPLTYAYEIVNLKHKQFCAAHKELKNTLFADSCVVVNNEIYGKAQNEEEAYKMLKAQSQNEASVISAMMFDGDNFNLLNLSITTYKFSKFNEDDLSNYLKSGDYKGKAGAMMIEGFNKKYILSQKGNTSTAMGLNVEILKAYL